MRIDYIIEYYPPEQVFEAPLIYNPRYEAKIIFRRGARVFTFIGDGTDEGIATLEAVQSFLDGRLYSFDLTLSELEKYQYGNKFFLDFGPMPIEVKDIIQKAIDLKIGHDKNKLMETFA
jgi:hypothetical protein